MIHWYTREGLPIPTYHEDGTLDVEAMRLVENLLSDPAYKRVAQTTLADGTWISTVWLGLDHRFIGTEGPPLIFETMVFSKPGRGRREYEQERYSTEAEAVEGHKRMVEKYVKVTAHSFN